MVTYHPFLVTCHSPAAPACHVVVSTKMEALCEGGSVIRTRRMSKVQIRAGAAAAARLAYFLKRLSVDLVGIARATKGDVTPSGEKFLRNPAAIDQHLFAVTTVFPFRD
jgi:hypothetical protein